MCPPVWARLMLSRDYAGSWGVGRNATEVGCPSHPSYHWVWDLPANVSLDRMATSCLPVTGSRSVKYGLSSSVLCSLEASPSSLALQGRTDWSSASGGGRVMGAGVLSTCIWNFSLRFGKLIFLYLKSTLCFCLTSLSCDIFSCFIFC